MVAAGALVKFFGQPWDAPVCDDGEQVDVPVGQRCEGCGRRFTHDERGLVLPHYASDGLRDYPIHVDCLLAKIAPGPNIDPHDPRTAWGPDHPSYDDMGQ